MRQTLASDPIGGASRETPWSRTFAAHPEQAAEARRFLASLLPEHPAAPDAVACLAELVANSIQHSRSTRPGGTFSVRMRRSGAAIRVEVTDQGGTWRDPIEDDDEHGRGLHIVQSLSVRCDFSLKGPPGNPTERTAWFEIAP